MWLVVELKGEKNTDATFFTLIFFFILNNSTVCRLWLCRLQITETLFLNELKINFICFIASIQHMRLNDRFLLLFKKNSYSWFIMLCLFLMYSSDSVIHICIFSYSFILQFITDTECRSLCHNSRNLLVIHYIYNSLHLLIPNSQKLCPLYIQ